MSQTCTTQKECKLLENLTVDLQNIHLNFGNKELFTFDRLSIYENDRIGIIGENGQGKSSLLKLITGELVPDQGEIHRHATFNFFSQQAEIDEFYRVNELDSALISRFNLSNAPLHSLSGGELTKYRLLQVLSVYQAGLILDEPTTHLDQDSIALLIEELRHYYGTLLIVSHDRYVLNQLATSIWEIKDGTIHVYPGNYDDYLAQKEQAEIEQAHAYERYQQEKSRLEKAASAKREQARQAGKVSSKQKNKHIRPSRLNSSKQKDTVQKTLHKTANAIAKRMEQLDSVAPIQKDTSLQFPSVSYLAIHNAFPIMGEDITLSKGDKLLLDQISFQFPLNKTIALTGGNGTGKSSLLTYILEQDKGITVSPKAKIVSYLQMDYQLTQDQSPLELLLATSDYPEVTIRAILTRLGFDQRKVHLPLNNLSGGEATRLALARVFTQPSNIIVLDEPTNFIDLNTREALEDFILAYPGTVLVASHDRYFIEKVADHIYQIEKTQLKQIK